MEQEEPAATAIRMVDGKEEFSIRFDKEDSVVAIRDVGRPKNLGGSGQESVIEVKQIDVRLHNIPLIQLRDPKNDFIFNFNFNDKMKNL